MELPFFKAMQDARNILIAGAGGGFDIFGGIPLHAWLRSVGKTVVLANYSFTILSASDCDTLDGHARIVDGKARPLTYFPEKLLVDWFREQGQTISIVAFPKSGVLPLLESYRRLVAAHDIDTIVLVDGGTDSLVKGDEPGLGTIVEDATSIAAVHRLDVPRKFLACIGFGIDHYHGISHHSFLENTAELSRSEAYLGAISVTPGMTGAAEFLSAVDYANRRQPHYRSIVNNSIADAILGKFGDVHSSARTEDSELFINPLMAFYWFYDLPRFVPFVGFLDAIAGTRTENEVLEKIESWRRRQTPRPLKPIPL